jgi:hypothetical protein
MMLRFAPGGNKHRRRFFKRMPMDTGLEWDTPIVNEEITPDNKSSR